MRAAICASHDGPDAIEIQELPEPEAGRGQVVIDVKAAGLNFPDLLMSRGLYQLKPPPPFAPGGEVAGVVSAVGDDVSDVRVGDRVMALTGFGGFCEKVVVGTNQIVKVPDSMDLTVAGGFAFTYGTSYHALKDRAQLREGERLLVLGAAGGVGLTAVELGRVMGAQVIAAASTADKLDLCERYGATGRINYAEVDLKQRAKELGGADVVYDPVGGEYAEQALRALKPFGRFLVIGFASGSIPSVRLNLALLKECSIVGVAWGAWAMRDPAGHARNIEELLALHGEGRLEPHISETLPIDRVPDALKAMDERKVKGKVVFTF
ncbi:MAG: NADPH:quinone oxidoreductase family protein [Myxococcota bacterium]